MPQTITVNVDIDIALDKTSFDKFRSGLNPKQLIDPNLVDKARILGTCNISKEFSCDSILEDLIKINPDLKAKDFLLQPKTWTESGTGKQVQGVYLGKIQVGGKIYVRIKRIDNDKTYQILVDNLSMDDQLYILRNDTLDAVDEQKCEIISKLKNTNIDYYLAYVFENPEKSISISGTDQDNPDFSSISDPGGGHLELLTSEPLPSNKSSKGITTTDSTQGVEVFCDPCISVFNKLEYKELRKVPIGDTDGSRYNIAEDFDWRTLGFSQSDPPVGYDGVAHPIIADDGNMQWIQVGATRGGVIKPMARYSGFNNWLYTRYYGGNSYSLVPEDKSEKQRICINLGKIFSVSVSVKTDKMLNKNIVSLSVSGDTLYLGVDESGKPSDTVTQFKKSGVSLDCCREIQENLSNNYQIFSKLDDGYGRLKNQILTIDQIVRAQGGLYSPEVVAKLRPYAEPGADKSVICCNECFYCIVSTLCPGMAEIFNEMRQKETNLRDHNANPSSIDSITGKIDVGPQCVPYDKVSKYPIPKSFITEDSIITNLK